MLYVITIAGFVLAFLCGISLLVKAFKESIAWGLACFFIPIVQLVFVFLHWSETKYVFIAQIIGSAMAVIGLVCLAGNAAPSFQFDSIPQPSVEAQLNTPEIHNQDIERQSEPDPSEQINSDGTKNIEGFGKVDKDGFLIPEKE